MITGVYIWAFALGAAIINMILIFAFEDDYAPVGIVVHFVCAIVMLIGLVVFGINFIEWLQAH